MAFLAGGQRCDIALMLSSQLIRLCLQCLIGFPQLDVDSAWAAATDEAERDAGKDAEANPIRACAASVPNPTASGAEWCDVETRHEFLLSEQQRVAMLRGDPESVNDPSRRGGMGL